MIYAREETLLGLAFDICESKSEVNEVFKQYLYKRERDKQENSCPSSNKIHNRWIRITP